MREYVLVLLVAAAVTYLLTPLVRRGAIGVGALKVPRRRDVHSKPTPTLGGIAMYCGLAAGLLVADRLSYLQQAFTLPRQIPGLLLAGGVLVLIGIIDDRWGLGVVTKAAGQIAAGGVLVWSGVSIAWIPEPNGTLFVFDGLESTTLTIAIIVITINAVNFIDGLDGLAAGVVAVAALAYLVYSYRLLFPFQSLGLSRQSLPAVSSAVLAGMCLGFLPHNFYPARIFMGDTGAMLLGLLLAYGPISSTGTLDPGVLTDYPQHPLNRFPAILPLLVPVMILIIPYADLMLAVIRRYSAGRSLFSADTQHLHHRLLNIGHSQRQSVLIMYLWAALFAGTVVALSMVRTGLIWLVVVTVVATLALLPATIPRLRPWGAHKHRVRLPDGTSVPGVAAVAVTVTPASAAAQAPASAEASTAVQASTAAQAPESVQASTAVQASAAAAASTQVPASANGDHATADQLDVPTVPFPAPAPFPSPDPFPGPDPLPSPGRYLPSDLHAAAEGYTGHGGFQVADRLTGPDPSRAAGDCDELPDLPPGWPSPQVHHTPHQ